MLGAARSQPTRNPPQKDFGRPGRDHQVGLIEGRERRRHRHSGERQLAKRLVDHDRGSSPLQQRGPLVPVPADMRCPVGFWKSGTR